MKSKKLVIAIIAIVLVITICLVSIGTLVVGAAGALIGAILLNQPEYVASHALTGVMDDLLAREEIAPFGKVLKGGSVEFTLDDVTLDDGESLDVSAKGTAYFSKKACMLNDFHCTVDDFRLSGDAYISRDEAYVYESEILGDAYGFELSQLADDLKGSIFAPESGSEYALDSESFDLLINALENAEQNEEMEKDAKKLAKRIYKDLWEIVVFYADIESESADVFLNGSMTNCRQITITVDATAAGYILEETYYYLRNSKDICKFLEKYEDILVAAGMGYDTNQYSSLAEAYVKSMEEEEENVLSYCDGIEKEFTDITLKIATPELSSTLRKLELYVDGKQWVVLDCGKEGIRRADTISLEIDDIKVVYNVDENSKDRIFVTLDIQTDVNTENHFYVSIDKQAETYVAGYRYSDANFSVQYGQNHFIDEYTVTGSISTKGDTTTLTVDEIRNDWRSEYLEFPEKNYRESEVTLLDAKLIVDTKDRMPARRKDYRTISDITESDIQQWLDRIEAELIGNEEPIDEEDGSDELENSNQHDGAGLEIPIVPIQ